MKFNEDKSQIIFYTHYKKWNNIGVFEGIEIVKSTKVLGYTIDQKLQNHAHVSRIQEKVERIMKTMNITQRNGITFWKKYYILMTYGLPYIIYGSNAFLASCKKKDPLK